MIEAIQEIARADREQPVIGIILREMVVDRAAGIDGEIGFLELRYAAGPGGEQDRLFYMVFFQDAVPQRDLLACRQIAKVFVRVADGVTERRIPRLTAGPQRRAPAFRLSLQIALNIRHMLENVSVGIDRRDGFFRVHRDPLSARRRTTPRLRSGTTVCRLFCSIPCSLVRCRKYAETLF